jgi:hypothetical protein
MSELYTPLGNYPKKFNKRESKLADKVSTDSLANVKALLSHFVVMAKLATNVSQTVDFAALAVGDIVVQVAATPGNPAFMTVATAGTLPVAAVVGDLYIALRAK